MIPNREAKQGVQWGARAAPEGPVSDPDLEIVELAKRRSTRAVALGVLYERFRVRVYNVALRVVGNADEANDVLQDVFVLLFRKIQKFRARSVFASWVYRITVNLSLDHLRQRRRNPLWGGGTVALDSIQDEGRRLRPDRAADVRDLEEHVQRALGMLSDRLRIVVVLRYLEGLSYQEIAEILNCSLGTVKSRLNRAHTTLRRVLGPLFQPSFDAVSA